MNNPNLKYTGPLRQPHFEGPGMPTRSQLSANAPEFVPKSGHQNNTNVQRQSHHQIPQHLHRQPPLPQQNGIMNDMSNNFNSMKLSSVQDRLRPQNQLPNNFSMNHQQQSHSIMQQHQHHHNSQVHLSNGRENNMGNYFNSHQQQAAPNQHSTQFNNSAIQPQESQAKNEPSADELSAINYIESIVKCLNDNPGSYDDVSEEALIILADFADNHFVLSNAMEIIFDKSIQEQNFRYMGAKLYNLLDKINLSNGSLFRKLLDCKLTYHQSEVLSFMKNEQHKVRGTTLFLAELYMQLRNDGCQIKSIASNIVFSIQQLLLKPIAENIKCICLTLKLAGYDLERDCPNAINEIMLKLSKVQLQDVSTNRILETVLNLQKIKWGRKSESLDVSNHIPNIRTSDEPVFYGPDGQILTEEENSFLEANFDTHADENDSDVEYDPEMLKDIETELAYKDFLKSSCANK